MLSGMKVGSGLVGATVAASLLAGTSLAHANGRFPASNQIVFSPTDPNTIMARTTFGFLPSTDNGSSWRWICEDVLALPVAMSSDPELAITASGALVSGTPSPYKLGVSVSNDLGCNWGCVGALASEPISDIVLRATAPHSVLAIRASIPSGDGGFLPAQIYETTDDGATWSPHGMPFDPTDITLQTFSLDVAKTDAKRIYVSATRGEGNARTASLFESTDDAQTWTERQLTQFDATKEGSIYIGAVDPTDADRVYLRSAAIFAMSVSANASCTTVDPGSRLFVTADAGGHFDVATLPITCQILGFALSADGSRVYAGTWGDGLFAASRTDLAFTKTSSIHVECLATRGDELWACSDAVSGFIVGTSTDEGACWQPRLPDLINIAGPLACAPNPSGPRACMATDNGSVCSNDAFQSLCQGPFAREADCFVDAGPLDSGCSASDSGSPAGDGGTDGGTLPRGSAHGSGCGCSTVGARGVSALAALLAAASVAAAAASRRRRRS